MAETATKTAPHRQRPQAPPRHDSPAILSSQPGGPGGLWSLQRAVGNRRFEQLIQGAQTAAGSISPSAGGLIQRQVNPRAAPIGRCPVCGRAGRGRCPDCGQAFTPIQRTAGGNGDATTVGVNAVGKVVGSGGGRPLDAGIRATMERQFARDFSQVRVHTDARAASSARAVDALAYTAGRNIVFARGQYDPGSRGGLRLLAHELTHVAQQQGSAAAGPLTVAPADSAHEREADAAAEAAIRSGAGHAQPRLHAPRQVSRQQPPRRTPTAGQVQSVEISCAANAVTFHTADGDVSFQLTSCDLTDGEYDATVTTRGGDVTFGIGAAETGRRFHFTYRVDPGRPNPATLFGTQSRVRIIARSDHGGDAGAGQIIAQIPVQFVASEEPGAAGAFGLDPGAFASSGTSTGLLGGSGVSPAGNPSPSIPGYPATTLGLSGNVLASGDLSWLSRADAARRILGREYWAPLVPRPDMIELDRILGTLPRSLEPRIVTNPQAWLSRGFTQAQLDSIPGLVARLNTGGVASLTPAELALLRQAADIHIAGATPGSPFASYMRTNAPAPNVGTKNFRVRVEVPRTGALDVSVPNEFNQFGVLDRITNIDEAEFMVVANQERRILSVQRLSGSGEPSALLRSSGAIRWGGRVLVVAGAGLSAYNIATATPEERPRVIGEEAGGQIGGAIGTAAAAAGCVFFGIATGGVGLFLCGLAGGVVLGYGGSAVGGAIGESFGSNAGPSSPMTPAEAASVGELFNRTTVCPTCHPSPRGPGVQSSGAGFNFPQSPPLTPADMEQLRRWLE